LRDEIQDFELNIRGVSGGEGLISDGQNVVNLQPTANTGRSAGLDAIAAYISLGIRAPVSPLRRRPGVPLDPAIVAGRALFASANCQSCHGGPSWTRCRVEFTPPRMSPPEAIVGGQLVRFLKDVGTFNPAAFNEVRANTAAVEGANGELGFNIPSLVSMFASAPYLHSGAAPTLVAVLANVTHRSAGTAAWTPSPAQRT
jgi:cytochrome c peroxidase